MDRAVETGPVQAESDRSRRGFLLARREILVHTGREIGLDALDYLVRRDHVHAARQVACDIGAQVLWFVRFFTIAQCPCARAPAAAGETAGQGANGVNELMVRVRLPMRWLTPAGNDDRGARARAIRAHGHRGREVH